MPRYLKVAAAQLGPNNEGTSREEIVERMLGLLTEAAREGVELIAYPEMALTTYFPKKIRPDFDQFFETEVPPKALEPLLSRAAEARIAVHVSGALPRGARREGRGRGRRGAGRRDLHQQPARPAARPRRGERRRAGGGADLARADAPRQEALELPRPAPASALRESAPAGG